MMREQCGENTGAAVGARRVWGRYESVPKSVDSPKRSGGESEANEAPERHWVALCA